MLDFPGPMLSSRPSWMIRSVGGRKPKSAPDGQAPLGRVFDGCLLVEGF